MIEKIKFFGIIAVIFLVLIFAIMIVIAMKRRKRFKNYLAEPLEKHLGDSLNSAKYEDWREQKADVYIYGQMARYAEQAAFQAIPKRKRFDKDGMYTPVSQQKIAENIRMLTMVLTNDGRVLNDAYSEFILTYRPYYTVSDFYKSILEYFSFVQNPGLFEKPAEPDVAEVKNEEVSAETDDNERSSGLEYTDIIKTSSANATYKDPVVHFSSNITVDHQIMTVLQEYSEKLAMRSCEKKNILAIDNYGNHTKEYDDSCRANYNKLCKIFFDQMKFKKEFVDWINTDHMNMDDVTMFDELIPMYIRYIKGKE